MLEDAFSEMQNSNKYAYDILTFDMQIGAIKVGTLFYFFFLKS